MNSKQLRVVLGVALVIVLAIVGYMALKDDSQTDTLSQQDATPNSNQADNNTNMTQPLNNTNTYPVQRDETANWKTTTNNNLGYSIKYPDGWKSETNSQNTTLTNLSNSDQVIKIQLNSINANPNRLSINEWLKTQEWPDPKPISEQFKSIATVGGVNAVEQQVTGTVYFTKGTNVFVVDNGISFERKVIDEKLFLQILSTFKFTK